MTKDILFEAAFLFEFYPQKSSIIYTKLFSHLYLRVQIPVQEISIKQQTFWVFICVVLSVLEKTILLI